MGAQALWRRVIGRYTADRFEEQVVDGRPVQLFDTVDWAGNSVPADAL